MKEIIALVALLSSMTDSESLKFQFSSEQGFDSSCGFSAIVALMDIWWGMPITETELLEESIQNANPDGDFRSSFTTLSTALKRHGFATKAFMMDWEQLKNATNKYSPIIIHFDDGEGHFTLLLGITGDTAIVADPAQGTTFFSKAEFMKEWSGNVLLAMTSKSELNSEKLELAKEVTLSRMAMIERTVTVNQRVFR